MQPKAALRIFWALKQEALCHDCLVGLGPDDLRILYHWREHRHHGRVRRWPDFSARRQAWRN